MMRLSPAAQGAWHGYARQGSSKASSSLQPYNDSQDEPEPESRPPTSFRNVGSLSAVELCCYAARNVGLTWSCTQEQALRQLTLQAQPEAASQTTQLLLRPSTSPAPVSKAASSLWLLQVRSGSELCSSELASSLIQAHVCCWCSRQSRTASSPHYLVAAKWQHIQVSLTAARCSQPCDLGPHSHCLAGAQLAHWALASSSCQAKHQHAGTALALSAGHALAVWHEDNASAAAPAPAQKAEHALVASTLASQLSNALAVLPSKALLLAAAAV